MERQRDQDDEVHLFDQTNGLMAFDPEEDDGDVEGTQRLTLLEKGAASNIVNGGMGGF